MKTHRVTRPFFLVLFICLCVFSLGIGISQTQLAGLFRAFSQVHHSSPQYGGTGLVGGSTHTGDINQTERERKKSLFLSHGRSKG